MDAIAFTRELINIESITGNEAAACEFVFQRLTKLGYNVERMPVEGDRFNVYATSRENPRPEIVLSTHIDTVPPFIQPSEDEDRIWGRGSCDAKGILAAQVAAAERLRTEGIFVGMLFVVGEERDSTGAQVANEQARGSRFLINGEPTENQLGIASKGTLRVQLTAHGRMAHSAYPELGESAIEKLLDALQRVRAIELPVNPEVGPTTMNIGQIEGGRAPNVIPDFARAQLLYRLVGSSEKLRHDIEAAVGELAEIEYSLEIPFVKLRTVEGLPTFVAKYTTDIPTLTNWGEPLLFGPGSIHVAHTEREHIDKKQLLQSVDVYCEIVKKLSR